MRWKPGRGPRRRRRQWPAEAPTRFVCRVHVTHAFARYCLWSSHARLSSTDHHRRVFPALAWACVCSLFGSHDITIPVKSSSLCIAYEQNDRRRRRWISSLHPGRAVTRNRYGQLPIRMTLTLRRNVSNSFCRYGRLRFVPKQQTS